MTVARSLAGVAAAVAVAAIAAACNGGPSGKSPNEPRAIDVAPPPSGAPPAAPDRPAEPAEPAGAEVQAAPVIAIGNNQICERVGSRLHCTKDLDPATPIASTPPVAGLEDVIDVAHGNAFTCAATRRGQVLCWGANEWGQIGAGSRALVHDAPTPVTGVTGARRVFAGGDHACAIVNGGQVYCWGRNESGQTGSATHYLQGAHELVHATQVEGVRDVRVLAAGRSTTFALTLGKTGLAWGRPVFTQQTKYNLNDKPGAVSNLARFEDVSGYETTFCGVRDGGVTCFGELYTLFDHAGFTGHEAKVPNVKGATRVQVARSHACALLGDGAVWCWGMNYAGALGRASAGKSFDNQPPELVANLPAAADIVAGDQMSCATTSDRKLWCWGTFPSTNPNARRKEMAPVLMAR